MKNIFALFLFVSVGFAVSAQKTPASTERLTRMESTAAAPLANFYGEKMFLASYKVDGESRSFPTEIHFIFNEDGTLDYFNEEEEHSKGSWNYKPENHELTINYDGKTEEIFTIEDIQKRRLKIITGNEETILYVKSEKKTAPVEISPTKD